jgi:hypothetical protein
MDIDDQKVQTFKAFGHDHAVKVLEGPPHGMTLVEFRASMAPSQVHGSSAVNSNTTYVDKGVAMRALRQGLEKRGMRFSPHQAIKASADLKAPLRLQVIRAIEPPSSGPRTAQVEVTFEAGEVVIGHLKKPTSPPSVTPSTDSNRFAGLSHDEDVDAMDTEGRTPGPTAGAGDTTGSSASTEAGTGGNAGQDNTLYTRAHAWPSKRLTIRLQLDLCPNGRILLALRHVKFSACNKTSTADQLALATFQDQPTHMKTAWMQEAAVNALRGKLPMAILEQLSVEHKLQQAPLTYLRGRHGEIIKSQLPDMKKLTWALGHGVQMEFTVEHDYVSAVKEERAKEEARAKARIEQDRSVDGRKVKIYGKDVFDVTTAAADVKRALHSSMATLTQQAGAGAADLWKADTIVTCEVGRSSRGGRASKGSGHERAVFVILANKAAAEWMVEATKLSQGSRLKYGGRPVQAHVCRPRQPHDNSSAASAAANGREQPPAPTAIAASRPPPPPRAGHVPPPSSSIASASSEVEPGDSPPSAPATAQGIQPRRWEAAGAQTTPSNSQTIAPPSEDLVAQLIRAREQSEADNKRLQMQVKQQETATQRQLEKLKQTFQEETQKQLDQVRQETAAQLQMMKATFQKQLKAQQDIGLQETRKMMLELKDLMDTQQAALLGNMKEMLREALSECGARTKPGFTFDIGTTHDSTNKKRRHVDGKAAAVEDTANDMLDGNEHDPTHDDLTTSTDPTLSSLPIPPAGRGGGGN